MNSYGYDYDECVMERIKHPSMYAVIYHNDHQTTAEFVVRTLCEIFDKDLHTATIMMQQVDQQGQCRVGVYTRDIAMTKRDEVMAQAKSEHFPFLVTVEPADTDDDE